MAHRMRTEAEERQFVAAWRRSGVPKTRFDQDRGLPASAFSRWITRYDAPTERLPAFTTVEVILDSPALPLIEKRALPYVSWIVAC